jgi:cytochrome c oxidase subunit 2
MRLAAVAVTAALLAGCGGVQSALEPAGPQAARVERLWWFLLIVATSVFVLVVAALLRATRHGVRARDRRSVAPSMEAKRERRMIAVVSAATVVTVIILFAFLIVNFSTERALGSLQGDDAVAIEVVGAQWWWRVRYVDSVPSRNVVTANEIHVPVGVTIKLTLEATDVIHSFWVPSLVGKRDLIPGRSATLWLRADSAGVYRGQCAEFCGHQHAKMAFTVVAEPRVEFDAWLNRQREPAATPVTADQRAGRDVFLRGPCALCHTIRGTDAGGVTAPDLTHLASRGSIAAASIPNTRGHLGGWIANPQGVKPGAKMPAVTLSSADLQSLLSYLESLR